MTNVILYERLKNTTNNLIIADSGWKVVYEINNSYFIEDIIAYVFIKSGDSYELIPLTIADIHLCQSLNDYMLKDGYIGLINPQKELIVNNNLGDSTKKINLKKIKKALKKNRLKLE